MTCQPAGAAHPHADARRRGCGGTHEGNAGARAKVSMGATRVVVLTTGRLRRAVGRMRVRVAGRRQIVAWRVCTIHRMNNSRNIRMHVVAMVSAFAPWAAFAAGDATDES